MDKLVFSVKRIVAPSGAKMKTRELKAALMRLRRGSLSDDDALRYTDTCQRLHRSLMAKFRKEYNRVFAQWICKDLLDKSRKLHAYIKNSRAPQCM